MARPLGILVADPHNRWQHNVGVIGRVERSPNGNVILAGGHVMVDRGRVSGWTKTEHIVLDPDEARELIGRIQGQLDQTDPEGGVE